MKIYLAGPMTGYEYFNFPAFDFWSERFTAKGEQVFSPADHDRILLNKSFDWMPQESDSEGPWKSWKIEGAPSLRQMLGDDLQWIAKNAEAIAMLQGWERSAGARTEWNLAVTLGLKVIYL